MKTRYMPIYAKLTVRKILKDRMLVRNRGNLRRIKDVFKICFGYTGDCISYIPRGAFEISNYAKLFEILDMK